MIGASLPYGPKVAPRDRVLARLAGRIPEDALALVPRKWEKLGRVLLLRLPAALAPHERAVAEAFAEVLGVETVLEDRGGVAGEYREMADTRLLLGEATETMHVENGVRYKLDAARLMFSSGNVEERTRIGRLDARGETVVDLFAGIGYFTLPLAAKAGAARVVACEKNPLAHRYLVENAALNGVADRVDARLGDCREVAPRGVAHRVVLGYFPGTAAFLPTALAALRPEGGVLHHHDTAPAESARERLAADVRAACAAAGRACEVVHFRVVKSYAPGIVHAVVDAVLR